MTTGPDADARAQRRFVVRVKQTGRATWLLLALVLLLFLYPLSDESVEWRVALGLLNTAILVTGAAAASASRRALYFASAFAVPGIGLQWTWIVSHNPTTALLILITMVLFYTFAIAQVLIYVLRPGAVTGNKLHGAIAGYIMLGLLWSAFYTLIDSLVPGSFDYMGKSDVHSLLDYREFVFFSFVTLTTTGYGDVVPVARVAQSTAIIEQLAGTFYIAVLIARLAGLYEPSQPPRPPHS